MLRLLFYIKSCLPNPGQNMGRSIEDLFSAVPCCLLFMCQIQVDVTQYRYKINHPGQYTLALSLIKPQLPARLGNIRLLGMMVAHIINHIKNNQTNLSSGLFCRKGRKA